MQKKKNLYPFEQSSLPFISCSFEKLHLKMNKRSSLISSFKKEI